MQVLTCAITRDGKKVVSGSYDKTLKVWDTESGIELLTLQEHTSEVILSFCFLHFVCVLTHHHNSNIIVYNETHRFSRVPSLKTGRKLCQDQMIKHSRCGMWNLGYNC